MRKQTFLRKFWNRLVGGRTPAFVLGSVLTAGLAVSLTTYAVHDIQVFELDNGTTGANAIDESSVTDAGASAPDDWGQNNFSNGQLIDPQRCNGLASCGYVSGPNVDPAAPGGGAFRSLFIQDPNGDSNNDTIYTGGGSKDDLDVKNWLSAYGSAPDKDDLLPVGAAAYLKDLTDDKVDNKELLIYLFGTLYAPNGDAAIGAWLFKKNIGVCDDGNPGTSDPFGVLGSDGKCLPAALQPINLHSIGDVFIVAQNSNGGRNVEMEVYKWVDEDDAQGKDTAAATAAKAACTGTAGSLVAPLGNLCMVASKTTATCTSSLSNDLFCGSMNYGQVGKPGQAGYLPGNPTESPDDWGYMAKPGFRPATGPASPAGTNGIGADDFPPTTLLEAGFNFTRMFSTEQGCFNSFLMDTRTSTSVRAQLKDLAMGAFPLCGIKVVKTGDNLSKIGDDVTYSYTITNTGAITLYRKSIIDDVIGNLTTASGSDCEVLAPGASCTFTKTYTVPSGAPDPLINKVEVVYNSAANGSGDDQTDSDDHSVNLFQPSITLSKTGDTLSKVGDQVHYTITLNNTSSSDSPNLDCTISDPMLGITKQVTVASGAKDETTQAYTIPEGAADPLVNTASVQCSPVGFPNVLTASDTHSINLFQPSVEINKTGDTLSKVGDDATYTITVKNTSSADSPDLVCTLSDAMLGINKKLTLASGATDKTTQAYTIPEGAADPLVNMASVSCSPFGFPNVLTASDTHSINLFQPSITLSKEGDELSKVGDQVNYVITLTNTSSADSPDLVCTVTDAKLGISKQVTLASGANDVTKATYTVLASDPDPLPNTATASCSPVDFPNVLPATAHHDVNLFQPAVTIDKTADCTTDGVPVGADITYTFTIHNGSSSDSPALNLASISDTVLGDLSAEATTAGCDVLSNDETCTFTKVMNTSNVPVGTVTNTVNVNYHPSGFPNDVPATDQHSCTVVLPNPAKVVVEKVLLNTEGVTFNYADNNVTVPNDKGSFSLTPLFSPSTPQNGSSPFAAAGAGNGFATTQVLSVAIPNINQTVTSTVAENLTLPANVTFNSLVCSAATGGSVHNAVVNGALATLTLGSGDFAFCRYVNEFSPGVEGCTPGFWKQDFHFGFWTAPYNPNMLLSNDALFDFPPSGPVASLSSDTMLMALNYTGGNGLKGGAQILLRAGVAGVLNAAYPGLHYAYTLQEVIDMVNTALKSGNRSTMINAANLLDAANNGVTGDIMGGSDSCPIGGQNP